MPQDRVMMRNPNTGRDDVRISAEYHVAVRSAILRAVGAAPGGLPFSELADAVERGTPPELWEDSSVGWYTTTVKLDMEAGGLLERSGSPQVLTLTARGHEMLDSLD